MAYKIILATAATNDMNQAYLYYEANLAGLGEQFLQALHKKFTILRSNPYLYSRTYQRNGHDIRDVAITKFPYNIVYGIIGEKVWVYRIHHTLRKPLF